MPVFKKCTNIGIFLKPDRLIKDEYRLMVAMKTVQNNTGIQKFIITEITKL